MSACVAVNLLAVRLDGVAGGAAALALRLLAELARDARGFRYVLLAQRSDREAVIGRAPGCEVLACEATESGSLRRTARRFPSIARLARSVREPLLAAQDRSLQVIARVSPAIVPAPLRRLGADLLFCPMSAIEPFDATIPAVATIHDLQHVDCPENFSAEELAHRRRFYARTFRRATLLGADSDFTRQAAITAGRLHPDRIRTIACAPCVDSAEREPGPGADQGSPFILYPANLWPHKNHRRLLDAFSGYVARHPSDPVRLVLTGAPIDGRAEIEGRARALGIDSQVELRGYVADGEIASLFRQARFLVFPSLFEGFGMPVVEAMAAGCPVACSRATALPEVAGEAALFFDPLSTESIEGAIERLSLDERLRGELRERGFANARRFSVEKMAGEYRRLFDDALELWARSRPSRGFRGRGY